MGLLNSSVDQSLDRNVDHIVAQSSAIAQSSQSIDAEDADMCTALSASICDAINTPLDMPSSNAISPCFYDSEQEDSDVDQSADYAGDYAGDDGANHADDDDNKELEPIEVKNFKSNRGCILAEKLVIVPTQFSPLCVTQVEFEDNAYKYPIRLFRFKGDVFIHASDLGSRIERKSNISRMFGSYATPRYKRVLSIHKKAIMKHHNGIRFGQASNVLSVDGLKHFIATNKKLGLDPKYKTWLKEGLLQKIRELMDMQNVGGQMLEKAKSDDFIYYVDL